MKIKLNPTTTSNFKRDLPIMIRDKATRMANDDVNRMKRLQILLYDMKFKNLDIQYRKENGITCIEIMFDNISMYLIPRKLFVIQNDSSVDFVALKHYGSILTEWFRKNKIYLIPDYFHHYSTKEWDDDTIEDFNQFLKILEIAFNRGIKLSTIAQ